MAEGCPKGYYRDSSGECRKSIAIRREGVYGEGFLSEPESQQHARIREEERREGPDTVERQMAALNSFQHGRGPAHEDLEYAESLNPNHRGEARRKGHAMQGGDRMAGRCRPGEEWVDSYYKDDGTHVDGYCREKREHVTAHDRRVDRRNARKARDRRR